jgi:hypothetical protein
LALDQKFNNTFNSFDLVFKVVGTDFGTRLKALIMVFLTFKTFDLVPKVVSTDFGTRWKVLITVFLAFKTFNLVPKLVLTAFELVPKYLALD